VPLLDDVRSPAEIREAALRALMVLDGVRHGGRLLELHDKDAGAKLKGKLEAEAAHTASAAAEREKKQAVAAKAAKEAEDGAAAAAGGVGGGGGSGVGSGDGAKPSLMDERLAAVAEAKAAARAERRRIKEAQREPVGPLEVRAAVRRRLDDEDFTCRKLAVQVGASGRGRGARPRPRTAITHADLCKLLWKVCSAGTGAVNVLPPLCVACACLPAKPEESIV